MRFMKHHQTLAALALGAALALPGLAESYTSASYVQQEHLVAQWDGIDNVGTGRHNPDATAWKDLKGNLDMTLTYRGRWNGGHSLFVSGLGAQGTNATPAYKTIEIVYRMARDGGRILFASGIKTRFVFFDTVAGTSTKKVYFDGNASTKRIDWSFDTTALCSAAATYTGDAVANVYFDGVARSDGTHSNGWGLGDGKVGVGNRKATDTSYDWTGEVYAIRLYDVALTAEEIAANHAIDLARFGTAEEEQMPTASDYVQDGLLVQWDGIDNAGTGVHNPNATTWKNLAGGGYDLTLTNNAAWNAEGRALVVDGISAVGKTAAPQYKTIEVVCKRATTGGRILFHGGNKKRYVIFDNASPNYRAYFTGDTLDNQSVITKYILARQQASEILFLAGRFDDNGIVTDVFKDADVREDGARGNHWGVGPAIVIGGRIAGTQADYFWYGEVYAIRLYGQRLTKAQLAHNHRIDCQRFLTSSSYVQEGLAAHWDGIDNAGRGLHDSFTNTWKNLVADELDLTLGTGVWSDNALMSLGKSAPAATGLTTRTYTSLEMVFRNLKHDTSTMLFSSGVGNRYFAVGYNHTQWLGSMGTTNFLTTTLGRHTLAGVVSGGGAAYMDGSPAQYEAYENWWDAGTNYVQVGARVHPSFGAYPFTGDFYAIRAYTNALSAAAVAYNAKIDRQRFKLLARTFTWNAKDGDALASGFFCTNGNWRVVEDTSSVPGASDAAVLPAGDYAATLNDEWVLDSLSVGAGATLRIVVPVDGNGAGDAVPLTLVNGLSADAAAGLDLDSSAFDWEHPRERVTLIACGVDSSAALQTLADSLNASRRRNRATVEDGTRLVYTAPPPSGSAVFIR